MRQLEKLDHWAKSLWTPIRERSASESEAVRNIREKKSDDNTGTGFVSNIRQAACERREQTEKAYKEKVFHITEYASMDEFLAATGGPMERQAPTLAAKQGRAEELLDQLLRQQIMLKGQPVDMVAFRLVQQKTALLNDLAEKMSSRTNLDSIALMEDLYEAKNSSEITGRLVRKDVPKLVHQELMSKLKTIS